MMQVGFRQVNGPSYAVAIRQTSHVATQAMPKYGWFLAAMSSFTIKWQLI